MLATFFHELKQAGVPVTLREYLTLMEGMAQDLAARQVEHFYYLARATLVKDERYLDRFDRVFGQCFKGLETPTDPITELPEEWLRKLAERYLTEEEKAQIEAMGGWEKLMDTLRQRLDEQKGRHQGGSKWIGTAGTSPFGAHGYNPEGVRIGQHEGKNRRAVKVWDLTVHPEYGSMQRAREPEAVAFADKHGLEYTVIEPHAGIDKPKSYADNFRYDRIRT